MAVNKMSLIKKAKTMLLSILSCWLIFSGNLYSYAAEEKTILLVEYLPKGENEVEHRMLQLSEETGRTETLLTQSNADFYLIECRDGWGYYINNRGELWKLSPKTKETIKIATIGDISLESHTGIVLDTKNQAVYAVSHSKPGHLRPESNSFTVKKYRYDGTSEELVSKPGIAYAISLSQNDILDVFTNEGWVKIDLKSGITEFIRLLTDVNNENASFVKNGVVFMEKIYKNHSQFDIRNTTLNQSFNRIEIVSKGYVVVMDLSMKRWKFLTITGNPIIAEDMSVEPDRLIRVDIKTGEQVELYKAPYINNACFMEEE